MKWLGNYLPLDFRFFSLLVVSSVTGLSFWWNSCFGLCCSSLELMLSKPESEEVEQVGEVELLALLMQEEKIIIVFIFTKLIRKLTFFYRTRGKKIQLIPNFEYHIRYKVKNYVYKQNKYLSSSSGILLIMVYNFESLQSWSRVLQWFIVWGLQLVALWPAKALLI